MKKVSALLLPLVALLTACGGGGETTPPVNNPPVAAILLSAHLAPFTGNTIELTGSTSSDPENSPLKYKWSVSVKGGSALAPVLANDTSSVASLIGYLPGTYTVGLIVNDGTSDSPLVEKSIVIKERKTEATFAATDGTLVTVSEIVPDPKEGTLTVTWTSAPPVTHPSPLGASAPPAGLPHRLQLFGADGSVLFSTDKPDTGLNGVTTHTSLFEKFSTTQTSVLEFAPATTGIPPTPTKPTPNSLQWVVPAI